MTQQRTKSDTSPDVVYYFDIVERLRSLRLLHVPIVSDYAEEAANEIERLRNGAAECCETVTLTDEEREAIYRAEARLRTAYVPDDATAAALRKLLERMP